MKPVFINVGAGLVPALYSLVDNRKKQNNGENQGNHKGLPLQVWVNTQVAPIK
jgi:hypothetical protein